MIYKVLELLISSNIWFIYINDEVDLAMNFNFLFAIVGNLNFMITFLVNEREQQDFFMFEGVNVMNLKLRFTKQILTIQWNFHG